MTASNDLNISQAGYVVFDGTATFTGRTFQAGAGITLSNPTGIAGNTTISSTTGGVDLHTARFIVSQGGSSQGANFTSIATAYAAAIAQGGNQTVFVQPGTYTENISLSNGINISAFGTDSSLNGTGNVIINGTLTMTTAGSVTISSIQLQTNSAALLAVTGSAASIVNLNNCFVNCSNTTGITYSSSSSSSAINIDYCYGNIGTTGISLFTDSSAGMLSINHSVIMNSGASTTASTISAGTLNGNFSAWNLPITSSSTAQVAIVNCEINTGATNTTSLIMGGAVTSGVYNSYIASGTASAVSVSSAGLLFFNNIVASSNTNAITGGGSISYSGINFAGTSTTINTTTQTISGTLQGSKNTAPTTGMIGEQIRATIASGTPVSLTTNTPANITSIVLTAGIWDITGIVGLTGAPTGVTSNFAASINNTSATLGTLGDNQFQSPTLSNSSADDSITIPTWRLVTTGATVYLVARVIFTAGSVSGYGRISATRVG